MSTPALVPPLEHKSWLRCYLDTGMPGHLATLVFLGALAFAVVIFRRRLGLRHRLVLLPLAMIPSSAGSWAAATTTPSIGATPLLRPD